MAVSRQTLKLSLEALTKEFDRQKDLYDNPLPEIFKASIKKAAEKKLIACWMAIQEISKELGIDDKIPERLKEIVKVNKRETS